MMENSMTLASNNIFDDLGFSPQEAENLRLRSELMQKITTFIETQNLTIEQALKISLKPPKLLQRYRMAKLASFRSNA